MTSLLWHRVSESEKEDIKKEAKRIMDSFSKKLDKLGHRSVSPKALNEGGKIEETFIEREKCERDEDGNSLELDREIFFENAPNTLKGTSKNKDFIVGEKGGWKE